MKYTTKKTDDKLFPILLLKDEEIIGRFRDEKTAKEYIHEITVTKTCHRCK